MVLQLHLFFGLIFCSNIWFRDLLREFDKKYEVLLIIFFLLFLLFLVSEGLLFVSFFWTSFHSLSSSTLGIWPGEGFYLPDPCELTFGFLALLPSLHFAPQDSIEIYLAWNRRRAHGYANEARRCSAEDKKLIEIWILWKSRNKNNCRNK